MVRADSIINDHGGLLFIGVHWCSLMFIFSAMNNILVPVDFSDVTPRVVKAAAQDGILRRARCPVLVVPLAGEEA